MKRKLLAIFTVLCCLQMLLSVSIAEDIAEEDILISGDFAYILRISALKIQSKVY